MNSFLLIQTYVFLLNVPMWKTMPGRVKQVPRDSTESDRTDTGQSTEKTSTRVISINSLF